MTTEPNVDKIQSQMDRAAGIVLRIATLISLDSASAPDPARIRRHARSLGDMGVALGQLADIVETFLDPKERT